MLLEQRLLRDLDPGHGPSMEASFIQNAFATRLNLIIVMDSPRGHSPREEDQIHDFAPRLDSKNDVSSHIGELKDGAIVRPW